MRLGNNTKQTLFRRDKQFNIRGDFLLYLQKAIFEIALGKDGSYCP